MALGARAQGILDLILDPKKYDDSFELRGIPKVKPRDEYGVPIVEGRLDDAPTITLSDLEGYPYLSTMSDRTAAGGQLVGIGDKDLAYPIDLTGGQDFMRNNPKLWASGTGPVNQMIQAGQNLKKEYGRDPVLIPWRMSASGSDFSGQMTGGTMMSYASANMPAAVKKQLDADIRARVPDFVGVDNPLAQEQFARLPDATRKFIQQQIMDKDYRSQGGISLPQARLAIADPSQLDAQVMGLQNVGLLDVDAGNLSGQGNIIYPDAVGGEFIGRLDTDATLIDLDPTAQYRATSGGIYGRPLSVGDDGPRTEFGQMRRAAEIAPYGGLIDDKLLRNLESKGIKVSANPFMTLVGVGLAGGALFGSEEADAGILSGTYKNVSQNINQLDKVIDRLNSGQPLRSGDLLYGSEGATFRTPQFETEARVFDELRNQSQTYGEPVFDRATIGSRINIAGRERVNGIARFSMPSAYQTELGRLNLNSPDMIEISPDQVGADLFSERINAAKKSNRFGAAVEAYDPDAYKGMRLFLSEDGGAGFALKPDGDLVSAFSDGSTKGVASQLLLLGIEQGAKKLDAFDTILPELYSKAGFRETSRLKFDPEQAPADFDPAVFSRFNEGQPDVSFMALDRGRARPVEPIYADDYADAIARQQAGVSNLDDLRLIPEGDLSIMPAPQRFFDQDNKAFKPFLSDIPFESGGRYLSMGENRRDLTGAFPKTASISIDPTGKPTFAVSGESRKGVPPTEGRTIKTNLFKKSAGWNWEQVPEGFPKDPDKGFPIVSVEDSTGHYYSLSTDYPEGVSLQRNPSTTEPRLRPETKGFIEYGNVVGTIRTRKSKAHPKGKIHNVYDKITVRNVAPAVIAGFAAAGQSEDADASYVGIVSKLGFGRQDLLNTAKRMEEQGDSPEEIWSMTGWEKNQADGEWRTELPNTNTKINFDKLVDDGVMNDLPTLLGAGDKKKIKVDSFAEYKLKDLVDDPELLDQYQPRELFRIADDRFAADYYDQPAPPLSSEQAKLIEEYGEPRYKPDFFDTDSNQRIYGSRQTGPLGDIRVVFDPNLDAGEGYWNSDFNTIGIGNNSTPEDVRGTLLHELQHAIQSREGFGAGMNADYIEQLQTAAAEFDIRGGQAEIDRLTKLADEYTQAYASGDIKNVTLEQAGAAVDAQEMIGRRALDERMREIGSKIDPEADGYGSPFAIYKNTAGEVEARNVEQRDRIRRLNSGQASLGELFPNRPPVPYVAKFDPDETPAFASERYVGGKDQSRQLFTRGDLLEETIGTDLDPNDFLSGTQLSKRYVDNIRNALKSTNNMTTSQAIIKADDIIDKAPPILSTKSASNLSNYDPFKDQSEMPFDIYNRPMSKMEANLTVDVFRSVARGFEDAIKMIGGGAVSTVEPESGAFKAVMDVPSVFGEYNETTKELTTKAGTQLGKVLRPALDYVLNARFVGSLNPFKENQSLKEKLIEDMTRISDQYNSMPDFVKEEVAPRIGYGTLAALGALTFYLPSPKPKPDVKIPLKPDDPVPQGLLSAN